MTDAGSIPRVVSQSFLLHSNFEAMEPVAKRAKIAGAFNELDLAKFSLKASKLSNGQVRLLPVIDEAAIHTNLTPAGWLSSAWGFDFSGRFECPSFLGGIQPEKPGTPEGLKIEVSLEEAQAQFLQSLDEAAKKAAAEHFPKAKWSPLVKPDGQSCKVKVILKGGYDLCKLTVVKDGKVSRGEGHEFLRSFGTRFMRTEVKLVLKVKSVWCVKGSAGLSLEATQLVLKPGQEQPEEVDAFGDDSELLA
jgi:hypothetical protein